MSDLVGNPEDLFSHNEAHIFQTYSKVLTAAVVWEKVSMIQTNRKIVMTIYWQKINKYLYPSKSEDLQAYFKLSTLNLWHIPACTLLISLLK